MSDTDEFRYTTAAVGDEDVAGLMDSSSFLPAEVPSHWAVYFSVADADEACGKATELGGAVIRPPEDTPFGRLAEPPTRRVRCSNCTPRSWPIPHPPDHKRLA